MNLFEYKKKKWVKEKEPIFIEEVKLPKNSIGWLVIDSIGTGYSSGGIRLGEKVDLEEVKLLANEMTLKRLFYNQTIGGAKAGIYSLYPLIGNERKEIFRNFGKHLKPFFEHKIYSPGTDMGTNQKDVEHLFEGAGIKRFYDNDPIDSSYYTAVTVFSVLKAIFSFNNFEFKEARLGIQGLGKVGLKLLKLASEHGIKLVAGSTQHGALYSTEGLDINRIYQLSKKYGDKFVSYYDGAEKISLDEFFEKDMDIMCPCAGIHPINQRNIDNIRAKIIVPGCNVAATEKIEIQLHKRGIMYLPGFVCNAGGVLGYTLRRFGIEENERTNFLSMGIQSKVRKLIEQATKSGKSPTEVARNIALQNQKKFTHESQSRDRMNGKLSISFRLKIHGPAEVIRTILWKLIEWKMIAPDYIRKYLAKKIVFERLFNN